MNRYKQQYFVKAIKTILMYFVVILVIVSGSNVYAEMLNTEKIGMYTQQLESQDADECQRSALNLY